MALREEYTRLINRGVHVLAGTGNTVSVQLEVNIYTLFSDPTMLMGCTVAGISALHQPGELADTM